MRGLFSYQSGLSVLLGLTFGLVLFDRGAISILAPFVVAELHLTNTQFGVGTSVLSLTLALGAFTAGRISDAMGRRKVFLILTVVVFSLCSAASGLVGGFVGLVATRLLMGLSEGPVVPLSLALMFTGSTPGRRGLNVGVFGALATLVGSVFAPLILLGLEQKFDWRVAFFLAGAPGLVIAAVIAIYVRKEPAPARGEAAPRASPVVDILRVRNVALCAMIAPLVFGFLAATFGFLPLFLVQVRGLSPIGMGLVMTVGGMSGLVSSLLLPALSDRVGRKPVMVGSALIGVLLPIACLGWRGGDGGLTILCGLAFLTGALPALIIGTIPAESVGPGDRGAALGLVLAAGEIIGGFGVPTLVGVIADRTSLAAAPLIAGACALGAGLLSLLLVETAPARQRRTPPDAVLVAG